MTTLKTRDKLADALSALLLIVIIAACVFIAAGLQPDLLVR